MDRLRDLATTSALMECVNCRREVEGFHLNCIPCFEERPDESPLQRCEHYECSRCGQEI